MLLRQMIARVKLSAGCARWGFDGWWCSDWVVRSNHSETIFAKLFTRRPAIAEVATAASTTRRTAAVARPLMTDKNTACLLTVVF